MPGVFLWGWDATNKKPRLVLVDEDGKLIISDADPFEVVQDTPEDLKHLPHGYYPTGGTYHPFEVSAAGRLLLTLSNLAHLNDIDDVNIAAPADGQFIYWDNATSKWLAKLLADADIPAAIARDAEVTAAVAAHAALTATHGVGKIASGANGAYTGNDAADRAIPHGLGEIARMVLIVNDAGDHTFRITYPSGQVYYQIAATQGRYGVTAPTSTNFYVGNAGSYPLSANANGVYYWWAAFG